LQGEIEGLMRTHPHLVHPRQQSYINQQQQQPAQNYQQQTQSSYMKQHHQHKDMHHHYGIPMDVYAKTSKRPLGSGSSYGLPPQRSFSSSEEELRSTPEFEGELIVDRVYHLNLSQCCLRCAK
jgi:regulating synaptic membrane exocytosis protein 2